MMQIYNCNSNSLIQLTCNACLVPQYVAENGAGTIPATLEVTTK